MKTTALNSPVIVPLTVQDKSYTAKFTHLVENPYNFIFRVDLNTGETFEAFQHEGGWSSEEEKYRPFVKALETDLYHILCCYRHEHFALSLFYRGEKRLFWITDNGNEKYRVYFDGYYYCDIESDGNGWNYFTTSKINNALDESLVNRIITAIEKQYAVAT